MKIDADRIKWIGNYMESIYGYNTGRTDLVIEDYCNDLTITKGDKDLQIEVKTVKNKKTYKSRYFEGDYPEGKEFYYLNASTKDGRHNSKWDKIVKGDYDGLIYIFPDEIVIFNRKQLLDEAFLGYCKLYQTHTTELDDKSKSYETKAMIDLSKGKRIKINPPRELFN